ncbi:hypothetical protein EJ03DRAFT_339344 [Teratosphaeria nubilosa]|uniref:Secreted protein n=1 Tax=Teratosphaeria nubilosa TaxID=161662 RepID=A0A6G1KXV6_9PEZI|nr:hypothetical protein EJ03DRAFT_339344 [Teratosphaeria nubilosa]
MHLLSAVTLSLFLSLGVDADYKFHHTLKSCGKYNNCRCHDVQRNQNNDITQMACARFWHPGGEDIKYQYDPGAGTCGPDFSYNSNKVNNCDFETFCGEEAKDNAYFQWCWK